MLVEEHVEDKHGKEDEGQDKYKLSSIKYGEEIMEAIELVGQVEIDKVNQETGIESIGNKIMLGGKSPEMYVLGVLKQIKYTELENSLKFVHMIYIHKLIHYVYFYIKNNQELELCTRIIVYILAKNENYLLNSKQTVQQLVSI